MPKLWNETIEAHRRDVHDAILSTTATLVAEHGPLAVTMSQIAEKTGIGRATLYKYYPGVEAIVLAWHERQVTGHLDHLAEIGARAGGPRQRFEAVLEAYAHLSQNRRHADLSALVHRGAHMDGAEERLSTLIGDLLREAARAGEIRADVAPEELATFCIHATTAASRLRSKAAVRRLVTVIVAGLDPI